MPEKPPRRRQAPPLLCTFGGRSILRPDEFLSPPAEILDLLVDTVFVLDPHGRILYVSASCEQLLGYTPDELCNKYMIEFVHPDDRGATLGSVFRVMAGEPLIRFENRWLHKTGSSVPIQWNARWDATHQVRVAVGRRLALDWKAI